MDKPFTIKAVVEDQKFVDDLQATLEREDRTMKAVVERALRAYIAQSKSTEQAETAAQSQPA